MHDAAATAAAYVRMMDLEGVEGGGDGGGFKAEGDEAETAAAQDMAVEGGQRPATFSLPHDVSHYRGQDLVQGLAASNAAAVLTGIPLISFAGSSGGFANTKFHQHQQQHHHQGSADGGNFITLHLLIIRQISTVRPITLNRWGGLTLI